MNSNDIPNYLGKGWSFPPAFNKENGVEMVAGEEDIRQSLKILLSTLPGERVFRSKYGCYIHRRIFDTITLSVETRIIDDITQAILLCEPRVEVEKVTLNKEQLHEGMLFIHIDYKIRQTNNRSNMVYPFYIKEGTNL